MKTSFVPGAVSHPKLQMSLCEMLFVSQYLETRQQCENIKEALPKYCFSVKLIIIIIIIIITIIIDVALYLYAVGTGFMSSVRNCLSSAAVLTTCLTTIMMPTWETIIYRREDTCAGNIQYICRKTLRFGDMNR